jgi:quercetin dioxygenase-like cupin family protein
MMKKFFLALVFLTANVSAQAQYGSGVTVEKVLKTDTTSIGQKIVYPNVPDDEVTIAKVTIPPGSSTGWHMHRIPVFAYVLHGTLTVELENGKTMQFPENSSFAEMRDTFHNGVNRGSTDVVLMAVYMGEKGKSVSEKKKEN